MSSIIFHVDHRPFRIRLARAFHRVPEDAVQQVLGTLIRLLQRQTRGGVGMPCRSRDRKFFSARDSFGRADVVRQRVKRSEIGRVGEAIEHRRGGGVELVHRRQTEHQFHRAQQAGLIVLRADDRVAFGVGADDISRGAITADMIPARSADRLRSRRCRCPSRSGCG